ncbi:MAG: cobalt-precorrin-6A reductase [Hoeflea sp.]|uniref:cobalt-precorrin-6A reductase n=1 Tax=Hoeflea sp. TaxID=1940281 RepID=UPI001DF68788|nr:cobalt-precorrin-6A reductase [Hoeflea sp.]MBU4531082.1 cobalt-precorrin-6A reductase [Alphaproteobacteria bacterium]MBU4542857.1 cobalt-precorrin-6A reductase [Alphaproteobacteria bacterium]MBU4552669.1 cobalt-precorrin-6A reductase [Alphaproteobacteria bacterium]MBV1722974.1 cobalt-precorrin-6A reductase [Hoeflea sp.]MBV1762885.1 cobalt-precorrin-6A reductase [Hoeflea sp.]
MPDKTNETILILGGTREATELARDLVSANPGARIITSLAGRTKEPAPLAGEVRTGGFGGAEGLADYIRANGVTRLIDATHPFARQISLNAVEAARITGVALDIRTRNPWAREPGDDWIEVETLEAARDAIPPRARVLLALGSQHIGVFASREDVHFVVRMIDRPETPLDLHDHALVLGRPGDTAAVEAMLLVAHSITHIVCRNSGGPAAYAKIEAARQLGLPVIMVSRLK